MTTLTTTHGKFIAVNVPEAYDELVLDRNTLVWYDLDEEYADGIMLPPGNYTLIGLSDSMTEEQAAMVVTHLHRGSYYENLDDPFASCATAKECFATWLRANLIPGRVAILKCIE